MIARTHSLNLVLFASLAVASLAASQQAAALTVVTPVADYRDDFQGGSFPSGWSYQWNANGAIGNSANYVDLLWTGTMYDSNGSAGLPDPGAAYWVNVDATGGHPGAGSSQSVGVGNNIDRYAIAGFQIGTAGEYLLSDTFLTNANGSSSGGDVRVYVNNALQTTATFGAGGGTINFDVPLGLLNVGDVVYVASGPLGNADFGGFTWDFTLNHFANVPEPSTLLLVSLCGLAMMGRRSRRNRA